MITHRVVGMLEYDMILVLDQGRLVEQGTHEELMENQGFYYELWHQQLITAEETGESIE
jgi:ABC-type multidrug transport system fused ATPase/permease subunit